MKNLKKVLSVLVVVAILLTSFVPAFAASQFTYEAEARTLYELGLFKGVSMDPNVFDPALDLDMDRQSGVIMMLRLVGKIDTANQMDAAEAQQILSKYTDAKNVEDWAVKGIAYAIKNDLVIGTTETTLSPEENFLGKMFAALILRNIGYEVTEENYDTACAMLVEKGGLTIDQAFKFNDKELIRDDMVGMSYGSLKAKYAATGKTIIETLVAEKKVDEAKAIAAGLITVTKPAINEVKAVGAKKLEVKFATAVEASKALVTVKKGSIAVNVAKVEFAADNKSAVVELATKLTKGDYTVTVAGIAEESLTGTVTAADEKVANIEFTSENAVIDRDDAKIITTGYKVYNQYNEDVTKNTSVTFTSSKGEPTYADGKLTLTADVNFTKDEKVYVSALHVGSATFKSATVNVVDKAQVADIEITSLYNEKNSTLDVNSNYGEYKLVVDAKDQYGNAVAYNKIAEDVIISVSNESIVKVGTFSEATINGAKKTVLPLVTPETKNAGTAKVTIISRTTGHNAQFDITVKDAAKVDVVTLQAPEFAVAGESFVVPFTAVDQFGNEIKDAAKGLTALEVKFTDSNVTGAFSQDYVKGTPKLTVNASKLTEAKNVLMTIVTPTGKLAQLTLNMAAPAKATVVSGTKGLSNKILVGGSATIELGNVVVKDQYGRDMKADVANYRVAVATSDSNKVSIVNDVYTITANDGKIELKGEAKGSSIITLKAQTPEGKDVSGSEMQFTMTVVEKSEIVSYELGEIAKIYNGGANYGVEVKVYGVMADGSKVLVPFTAENYRIIEYVTGLELDGNKVYADSNFDFAGKTEAEKEATIVVTVFGDKTTTVLTKNVVVTNAKPVATTIALQTSGIATKEGDKVVSVLASNAAKYETIAKDALMIKDQYGKVITPELTVIPTNLPEELKAGSSYEITAITDNAQVITFKVILK